MVMNAGIRDIQIQNRHGQNMHVRVYEGIADFNSISQKSEPQRIVFHQHGRSGTMDYAHNQIAKDAYIENGYTVVMVDSTNSQNNPSDGSLEQFSIDQHTTDLADTIQWAKDTQLCKNKFALAGHSMGGYSALKIAASDLGTDATHILAYAPVTDGEKQIQARYDNCADVISQWEQDGFLIEPSDDGKIQSKLTWEQFQSWSEHSIFPEIDKIKTLTVMIAGSHDIWVPPQHVQEAALALPNCIRFQRVFEASHSFKENLPGLKSAIYHAIPQLEAASGM